MENKVHTYWWKTKTFRIGLGVFIVLAVMSAVFFGDSISQLLDLFGSKAAIDGRNITVDDDKGQIDGHGYLDLGTYSNQTIEYVPPVTGGEDGHITLKR